MGGGSSSSASASNTTTNNTDARVVAGEGAIAFSNVGGGSVSVSVQTIDAGAVNQSFDFARDISSGAAKSVSEALQTNADIAAGAAKTVNQAFSEVANAWADAKAGENKILVGVGMAVVAVVALSAVRGKS